MKANILSGTSEGVVDESVSSREWGLEVCRSFMLVEGRMVILLPMGPLLGLALPFWKTLLTIHLDFCFLECCHQAPSQWEFSLHTIHRSSSFHRNYTRR